MAISRIHLPETAKRGEEVEVRIAIRHPMETGFRRDVNGVRRDKNDSSSLIHSLSAKEARRLIAERAIEAGMIPKVEACLETLQKGVRKIHIIDGRIRHSLMLEIYTNEGIGTEIVAT